MAARNVSLLRSRHINDLRSKLLEQTLTIDVMVSAINSEHERQTALITQLEKAGIIAAAAHYQQGKYLYLIYPMRHGKRKRTYVGADPKKRDEAEAKIANYQKFREHSDALTALELQAEQLFNNINEVLLQHKINQLNERINSL